MGMIEKLIGLIYTRDPILHSETTTITTRYGMYKLKTYRDGHYAYLAMMSVNFFDLEEPIVYIHSESHARQIDTALKMIYKEGGLVIYYSEKSSDIDALLREINTRKLGSEMDTMRKAEGTPGLKTFGRVSHTLGFILKDLNFSSMKLISDDPVDRDIARQLGIKVTNSASSITFGYRV